MVCIYKGKKYISKIRAFVLNFGDATDIVEMRNEEGETRDTWCTIDGSLFSVCTLNVDGLPAFDFVNNDGPDTEFTTVISRYLADKAFDFIGVQEN